MHTKPMGRITGEEAPTVFFDDGLIRRDKSAYWLRYMFTKHISGYEYGRILLRTITYNNTNQRIERRGSGPIGNLPSTVYEYLKKTVHNESTLPDNQDTFNKMKKIKQSYLKQSLCQLNDSMSPKLTQNIDI